MAALANHQRADLLLRLADELKKDEAELTQRICAETGKPVKEARVEASRSVNTLIAAATKPGSCTAKWCRWISLLALKAEWQ